MVEFTYAPHITHKTDPLNQGTAPFLLRQHPITPTGLFYIRNHGDMPDLHERKYRLEIDGAVERQLFFSLDQLKRNFGKTLITATLQCAGHRRQELHAHQPIPDEVIWGMDAVSTAVWGGVPLYQVLAAAGIKAEAKHVAFGGLDTVQRMGREFNYGSSIPLEKAVSPEVLLAYEMNGMPLAQEHGFPLRLIVPGYIGARSVKWLGKITLQAQPSDNYFQSHAYKLFPPHINRTTANWSAGIPLEEVFLNSAICSPQDSERLLDPYVLIQGYAFAGKNAIRKVEVSCDAGRSWEAAVITHQPGEWAWTFWSLPCKLRPGTNELIVRAFDDQGNTQPERFESVWNFKGYANNAWHRIQVTVG